MRARLIPCLTTLVAALPFAAMAHADDWNRAYAVSAHPRVEIVTDDGNVRLHIGDTPSVVFKVHAVGWHIEPGGLRVEAHQDGDVVHFEAHTPHFRFELFSVRKIEIDVTVPRELALDVDTGDGGVTLPALAGAIHVHTGDGAIEADGANGDLRLETGDGHIRGTDLVGDLAAHTSDGSLFVSGKFGRLALSSGDGRIEAELGPGSKVIADGWDVHTGDGSIVLRVPHDFAANLEADTGDGAIDVDLPLSVEGRLANHRVHGRINGGGGLLHMRSGDGSIHITGM